MVSICTASALAHVRFDRKQIPEPLGTCSCLGHNHNHKYVSSLLNCSCPAGIKKMISMKGDIFTDSLFILNYQCFLPLSPIFTFWRTPGLLQSVGSSSPFEQNQNVLLHRAYYMGVLIYITATVTISLKPHNLHY